MSAQPGQFCYSNTSTGMAKAVMAEVAEALGKLVAHRESSTIDLRSLPLTDADLEELDQLLGRGEVEATIQVIGKTEVHETRFAGVWWLKHRGAEDRVALEQIVVTLVPDILCAQKEDVLLAADAIQQQFSEPIPAGETQESAHG